MTEGPTLLDVVRQAMRDFESVGAKVALVGGLAVGARARERTTRDADFVVAVPDDAAAERLVRELRSLGYGLQAMLEHTERGRLATVRFTSPADVATMVDALFASSGIEAEVAAEADVARGAVRLIQQRGFDRGKDLVGELEEQIARWRSR